METPLAKQMIERADRDGLPEDHAMRRTAQAFDEISVNYAMERVRLKAYWAHGLALVAAGATTPENRFYD